MKRYKVIDVRRTYNDTKRNREKLNIFTYYILRPASFYITPLFINLGLKPNHVTWTTYFLIILMSFFLILGTRAGFIIASFLLFIRNLLDCVDGNMARVMGIQSKKGEFLDDCAGYLFNACVFSSLGIGVARSAVDLIKPHLSFSNQVYILLGMSTSLGMLLRRIILLKSELLDSHNKDRKDFFLKKLIFYTRDLWMLSLFIAAISNIVSIFLLFVSIYNLVEIPFVFFKKLKSIES